MISEFDFIEIYGSEVDQSKERMIREVIYQYIAAGILFPDEIRHAETILRQLNNKK
jgi:hypothetical protein